MLSLAQLRYYRMLELIPKWSNHPKTHHKVIEYSYIEMPTNFQVSSMIAKLSEDQWPVSIQPAGTIRNFAEFGQSPASLRTRVRYTLCAESGPCNDRDIN